MVAEAIEGFAGGFRRVRFNTGVEEDLLEALWEDPRASLSSLAEATGSYRQKVWRRVERLQDDGVLVGFSPVLDPQAMGWHAYMVMLRLRPLREDRVQEMLERAARIETTGNVLFWSGGLVDDGPFDLFFTFQASSPQFGRRSKDLFSEVFEGLLLEPPTMVEVVMPLMIGGRNLRSATPLGLGRLLETTIPSLAKPV